MREAFSFRRFGLVLYRELITGSGKKLLHAILALGCTLGVMGVIIGAKNSYSVPQVQDKVASERAGLPEHGGVPGVRGL